MKILTKKDLKSYLFYSSKGFFNFFKLTSHLYILPSIIIYPSNRCNYNCIMCEGIRNKKQVEQMDFSLMKIVIEECSSFFFKPRIHFSGLGEPLIYPEIKKVMQLCNDIKMKWGMTTNGYLLETYVEDLLENNCHALNISIHGTESEHNKITRISNSFDRVIKGIQKLERAKYANKKTNPLIAINCVITNSNVDVLWDTLNTFLQFPVNSINFQHLIFSEKDLQKKESFLITEISKLEKLKEFITFVKNNKFPRRINFFPQLLKDDIRDYYSGGNNKFKQSCVLPWLTARIYPDGNVGMCGYHFGNLKEYSLKSIINNKQARLFRDAVRKGKLKTPGCFRCCHRHYY